MEIRGIAILGNVQFGWGKPELAQTPCLPVDFQVFLKENRATVISKLREH